MNLLKFIGSEVEWVAAATEGGTPNTQRSTPNAQRPTLNAQRPTLNAQRPMPPAWKSYGLEALSTQHPMQARGAPRMHIKPQTSNTKHLTSLAI